MVRRSGNLARKAESATTQGWSPTRQWPTTRPPGEQAVLAQLRQLAPGFPVALVPQMLGGWAQWHGLVTLEVTGQLAWVYPDATPFFAQRMQAWVDGFTGGAAGRPSAPGGLPH